MKDLVKLNRKDFTGLPLRAVSIEIQFTVGEKLTKARMERSVMTESIELVDGLNLKSTAMREWLYLIPF
jgi:hypothetical protein